MRQGILRWTIYLLALLLFGPLAGSLTAAVRAVDGGPGATPLVCAHPAAGMAAALGAMGIALLVGIVGARLLGVGPGMISAGLVLAWATWNTGTVDELIRTAHSGSPFARLALEGVIFGALGLLLAYVLWAVGKVDDRAQPSAERGPEDQLAEAVMRRFVSGFVALFKGKGGPIALGVAVIAGAVAAWFIGVTPLKGQALFAAIGAGTLAAAAGRLVEFKAPMPSLFAAIAALAVLGPLSGIVTAGMGLHAVEVSYQGSLFPLAQICPLDWIAGGLLGIPLGVAWAGSMIERGDPVVK